MFGLNRKLGRLVPMALISAIAITGFSMTVMPASADEIVSSIARGGLLYDKWWKVVDGEEPDETHPAYTDGEKSGADTWRCKECHGWDYKGVEGAYSGGSHYSGIIGISGMAGADTADIIAVLTNDTHALVDLMEEEDFQDLANFVSLGQLDTDLFIDAAAKAVKGGDIANGEVIYNSTCARCHGIDGNRPKDMAKTLGAQMGNPWEVMHKIMNGHPGQTMPAFRVFGTQVALDVMAYVATMPKE